MKWRILAVDDDAFVARQIKEFLDGRINGRNGDEILVDVTDDFDKALNELDKLLYDIVILDVFRGKVGITVKIRPGEEILEEIKKRCFIPVVFYTALPAAVSDKKSDLVHVVHKTAGGLNELKKAVISLIGTGLPVINRMLINHFFRVQGEYMWKFVEPNWKKFSTVVDTKSLAYLLSRRLAWSLTHENIHYLIDLLGGQTGTGMTYEDLVHPVEYYIYPPIGKEYNTGDILSIDGKKKTVYWVVLTPACDMFQADRKAKSEYVLIAACLPLSGTDEVKKWQKNGSKEAKDCLTEFIKNNKKGGQKERYYFIPGTFFIPHLFVDFQALNTVPFEELEKFKKVATLDSPFAESMVNRFCRYIGRIGTPDINPSEINGIIDNLKKRKKK